MENGGAQWLAYGEPKIQTHHLSINLNGTPLLFY
jgi:hypothetical protein